jgi:WXXGXW repeat (2 copies)
MQSRFIRMFLFAVVFLTMSVASFGAVVITIAPPALPIYEQPICPGDGYLWTPGYWAWDDGFSDYYFVPGTWVMAPEVGFLWTPGYWGWGGEAFIFNEGYWGPQVGFYGGINYGFGYFGNGFEGGRWDNGHFFYNRSVANINVKNIHNVYNTTINERNDNRVSYNGGNGGINVRPTAEQEAAARERHVGPVAAQSKHLQDARSNPQQRASANEGKPPVAATDKPGDWKGKNVVKAKEAGAPYTRPANGGENQARANTPASRPENAAGNNSDRPTNPGHVRDLPAAERPAAPNTGNAKADKKYQQQQEKQYAQQQTERQKLQQKQEKEDQKVTKQNNDAKKQQVEQRHQQQTQQLQQRHQQQSQQMQQRMQPASPRTPARPPR